MGQAQVSDEARSMVSEVKWVLNKIINKIINKINKINK